MLIKNYSVFMRGVTWVRDSHGLFDYESKSISKKSWTTTEQAKILRKENDIRMIPLKECAIDTTKQQEYE
jgi:hypothetical protein